MKERAQLLKSRIRRVLGFFIFALVLSGITAFPLEWESELLVRICRSETLIHCPGLSGWLIHIRDGLVESYSNYPFLGYGTDWLGFGHLVIAMFFWGPWVDPVRNRWVLIVGIIACAMVPLLAFVCGPIRGIPLYWRVVDSSFGIIGLIPLLWCLHDIKELETLLNKSNIPNYDR